MTFTYRWQEAYSVWNGEYPPSPGWQPLHYATQGPLFPDEATPVDVTLHGWRLQSIEETGPWEF